MLHNYFLFPLHVQHMKQCKYVILFKYTEDDVFS